MDDDDDDDDDDDENFIHTRCVSKPQSCGAVYVNKGLERN